MASLGVNKLKRVMWRLQEEHNGKDYISKKEVEDAIIHECGIDPRTIKNNLLILKRLGWITCDKKMYFIEDKDYD